MPRTETFNSQIGRYDSNQLARTINTGLQVHAYKSTPVVPFNPQTDFLRQGTLSKQDSRFKPINKGERRMSNLYGRPSVSSSLERKKTKFMDTLKPILG